MKYPDPDSPISDPKQLVKDDTQNSLVKGALKILDEKYATDKVEKDSINYMIQDLFERTFYINSIDGKQRISSKMLQQAMWRVMSRTKILDFSVQGTGADSEKEKLMTDALRTIFYEGNLTSAFTAKDGVFYKQYLYGDGFLLASANAEKDGFPLYFTSISNTNVYVDNYATAIHGAGNGKNATKLALIFSYPIDEAKKVYPNFEKKNAGTGKIPRNFSVWKDTERTMTQTVGIEEDLVEVCHFFDIANNAYVVFAGTSCTILTEKLGEEYPFKLNKKSFIPVFGFLCTPASEGFWNHGIGETICDLAVVSAKLLNMEVDHTEDNTYPITIYNVPQGEAEKIFGKLATAYQQRAAGLRATVGLEYDPNSPNSNSISAQSLLTTNLTNQWKLIYDTLTQELARLGIILDDTDRGANITATQIEAEEESQSSFVKQVQEFNAEEFKKLIVYTLEFIKDNVPTTDKTPLNLTSRIEMPDGTEIKAEGITLGMVADELRKRNYFINVNSRSGAIPSGVFEKASISSIIPFLPAGSKAQLNAIRKIAHLSGQDVSIADLGGQAPPAESPDLLPTETDRLAPNPRTDVPALA